MRLDPGQVVDRYRIVRELGRGGMAIVYLVRHTTLDSTHALKLITVPSQLVRDRLLREGRVQARLRHPNLVRVNDVVDVGGAPGLVMEYIAGPSLAEWLPLQRPTKEEAIRLFTGIVSGVRQAHLQGVVHRDLKPANVLLESIEGVLVPKVSDFGLAKAFEEIGDIVETQTGVPMGTPAYMFPEQVRNSKNVDERTDIFSLGCILYELVCGRRAFDGADSLEVYNAVTQGRYEPPRVVVPGLSAALALQTGAGGVAVSLAQVESARPAAAPTFFDSGATDPGPRADVVAVTSAHSFDPTPDVPAPERSAGRWRWGAGAAFALGLGVLVAGGAFFLGRGGDPAETSVPTGTAPEVPSPAASTEGEDFPPLAAEEAAPPTAEQVPDPQPAEALGPGEAAPARARGAPSPLVESRKAVARADASPRRKHRPKAPESSWLAMPWRWCSSLPPGGTRRATYPRAPTRWRPPLPARTRWSPGGSS